MHESVFQWVKEKASKLTIGGARILEVGSLNVNGSVRSLFTGADYYSGIDMQPGKGVDHVMKATHLKYMFESSSIDIVISTEMLEHDDEFWISMMEMGRVLKPGGHLLVTARGNGFPLHSFPDDYWRFMPSGFKTLFRMASCDLMELSEDPQPGYSGLFGFGVRV